MTPSFSKEKHSINVWLRWMWFRTLVPYMSVPLIIYTSIIWGVQWYELTLLLTSIYLSSFGLSVGLHRYFTHHSFKTHPFMRAILGVLGLTGSHVNISEYVAIHRAHHAHKDAPGDPHSAQITPYQSQGVLQRLWYAHSGWLFNPKLDSPGKIEKYAADYRDDHLVFLLDIFHAPIFIVSIVLPGFLVAAIEGSFQGFTSGLLWGGLFRVFLTDQTEYSLRGISHYFGPADLNTNGSSRNHWMAYIATGEWRNKHRAFSSSARHGFKWRLFDSSYLFIALMKRLRLVWDVKPLPESRLRKKEASDKNLASQDRG